jgi:cell division protein FtsW
VAAERATLPARAGRGLGDLLSRARSGQWTGDALGLTAVVAVLVIIGLVMSFSASFVESAQGGDPFGVFRRQAAWATVGVVAFLFVSSTHPRTWRWLSWPLLLASIAGLVLVLVPGVGLTEGGSTRWLGVGPVIVQPSEIAKLAVLLWLADVHARKREHGMELDDRTSHLLVPALPLLAVVAALILAEPDLGTALIVSLIVLLVLWMDGIRLRFLVPLAAVGAVAAFAAAILEPYRFARVAGWLDPNQDPLGSGYQLLQSLYALGSGGWFGVGLGQSRGKWNFIPNPETDFIFAIIGEELGLVGASVVLLLFLALLVIGLRIARGTSDHFGRIVAFGVTGWIVGQAIVNIGAVTGLLPITGVTLPLVSVGGSSLVVTLVALALVVAIARASQAESHHDRRAEVAA